MEPSKQIETFKEFFDADYKSPLLESISTDKGFFIVNFADLSQFNPELADDLLDDPENVLKAASIAASQVESKASDTEVRFSNLPQSSRIAISNVRSKNLGKFIQVRGIVRQKSEVRPQVISSKFECPSCGAIIPVLQLDSKFKEPTRCQCGRRGVFREISKQLVDAQKIVLEEAADELDGGEQPKRLNIILKKDLISPLTERRTNPGSKIELVGYLMEIPIILPSGGKSTRFDIMMECNYVEPVEEDYSQLTISTEEEENILALAKDPDIYEKLIESVAPSIYGHERVKEALLLQMFGGVKKTRPDGMTTRGDMHVLLIGDPGSGKSMLLKRITKVAPKARFVSGKGSTAAGLTASVVKDDFLRGYALEAGALVLANKGFACIDELDKMSSEDRSAMHEALEQQCYHYDTELMLSDGSTHKIGSLVERLFARHATSIIQGVNCEILPTTDIELLTSDFKQIYPVRATNVSRHKAPEKFIRLTFSNGRTITVTPEHPVFVHASGMCTMRADAVRAGMLVPAPAIIPTVSKDSFLDAEALNQWNTVIGFPQEMNASLGALLGYVASEGHSYYQAKNSYAEVGVSNTDPQVANEVRSLFKELFAVNANTNTRPIEGNSKATQELLTIRCCSVPLYKWFSRHFPLLTLKAPKKRAGNLLRTAPLSVIEPFLRTAFRGDGFVSDTRLGYSTASYGLAKDYQDLLLRFGIYSYIATEKRKQATYYKVVVSGANSLERLKEMLAGDPRERRVEQLSACSKHKNNDRDVIPHTLLVRLDQLLRSLRANDGYFYAIIRKGQNCHRKTFRTYCERLQRELMRAEQALVSNKSARHACNIAVDEIACALKISESTVYTVEAKQEHHLRAAYEECVLAAAVQKISSIRAELAAFKEILDCDMRFVTVKKTEIIPNNNQQWVYDVQVNSTHAFISEALLLHNTVSISKANIQATLRCETVVLAAANPKYGRFDLYEPLAKQIDLPSTLINRFDLIFPIKDLPNRGRDEQMAQFILELHQKQDTIEAPIETELMKKYIAYSRQRCSPKLSQEALVEIKQFYVDLRSTGKESEMASIPISARQLEGLLRLAEASAKSRLSEIVTKEDARKAIDLVYYCLSQIGIDPSTGKLDIDRVSGIMPASERNIIHQIKDIIKELADVTGNNLVPEDDIILEAKNRGLNELKVEEALEKLNQKGDIFRPRHGFYSMMK